jgi:kynurenine formamidase
VKYLIDKWDQLKEQFTSNFASAMGHSGTHMDLAMVKQEQGETLRKYMRRFFDKRGTVVDVSDKEVINLFQDGLYHRRTFEDFGRRRPSSITHLKDMITSWADEEDKATPSTTPSVARASRTRVATATTTGTRATLSRLSSALRKTTRRRPLAVSKTC